MDTNLTQIQDIRDIYSNDSRLLSMPSQANKLQPNENDDQSEQFSCKQQMKQLFAPQSLLFPGTQRLISIDFLRGLSIFIALYSQQIEVATDLNFEISSSKHVVLSSVLQTPYIIFSSFTSFLVLLSGVSRSFSFFTNIISRNILNALLSLLLQLICHIISLVIWFILFSSFNILQVLATGGKIELPYPFWKNSLQPNILLYFAVIEPVIGLLKLLMYVIFIIPYKIHFRKYIAKQQLLYIIAGCSFISVFIMLLTYSQFANIVKLYIVKRYPDSIFTLDEFYKYSCPANVFINNVPLRFVTFLDQLFLQFLAGQFSFLALFSFFMMGFSYGSLFSAFQFTKHDLHQRINNAEADEQLVVSNYLYRKVRKYFLLFFLAFPFVFVPLFFVVQQIAITSIKQQLREPLFKFDYYNFYPHYCLVPEYATAVMGVQLVVILISLLLFESFSKQTCCNLAQSILYLRRMSTYSLTSFTFSYILSYPIKSLGFRFMIIEGFDSRKLSAPFFLLYIIVFYLLQFLLLRLFDTKQGFMTADWMLYKMKQLFQYKSKMRKTFELTDQHLKVQPISLFSTDI